MLETSHNLNFFEDVGALFREKGREREREEGGRGKRKDEEAKERGRGRSELNLCTAAENNCSKDTRRVGRTAKP